MSWQGKVSGQSPIAARPDTTLPGADTLSTSAAPTVAALGPLDNDRGVIAIERRLRCSCGCTLDVYTCRTTDFACTYSPAMHRQVVARVEQGETAQQIIDWFVAQPQYGEKVLMAPAAQGFNLAGYLVPGLTLAAFGLVLIAWLMRKRESLPVAPVAPQASMPPQPDPAQVERLQRALDDVES